MADFAMDRYGSYMLKAVHRRDGRVVAESMGAVALSYPVEYLLASGSLLYMTAEVQHEWKHSILPQPGAGGRISLTFRRLKAE